MSVLSEIRSLLEKRPKLYGRDFGEYHHKTEKWFEQFPKDVEKVLSKYACIERKRHRGKKET